MENKQIARQLFVTEHTVRVHLNHIFRKLAVTGRIQAALVAIWQGWILME